MTISGVDQPGDQVGEEHQGSWATRLRAAEQVVQTNLIELGVPTLHRRYGQRAGRAGLAGHTFELRVIAAQRDISKQADTDAADRAATVAGKLAGAVLRIDRMSVTLSIEGFAALANAATPEHLRDMPVTEPPPLGTAECGECGTTYELRQAVRDRAPTCSPSCRNRANWRRRRDAVPIPVT